jgi:peptidoglycan hydrolase-like protein with peptidoglycan-binding domain
VAPETTRESAGAAAFVPGDASEQETRRPRLPRRRWLAVAGLALAALAVLVVVLLESASSKRAGADTGVPPGDTTTTVTRRTLAEGATVDGTLGYGSKLELYDRVAGTFTWLPAAGAVVRRGGTLWRIDDEPIVLMYGSVPAYRTLKAGVSEGPDVAELNRNLIDLGYDPDGAITNVEKFNEATAAAVKRWRKAEGLTETGEVEVGRIVFAPGARRVTEVHVSLGQDPPGSEGSKAPGEDEASKSPASKTPAGKQPKHKKSKHKKPAGKKPAANKPAGKEPGASPPRNSPASKPSSKQSDGKEPKGKEPKGDESDVKEGNGKPESGSGAGELALTTTSTQQIVGLKVKPEQQQLARYRERVSVTLPGGKAVRGRITKVGTVAVESKGSGEERGAGSGGEEAESTVEVTVTLDRGVERLDEAPVSVELVKSVSRHVLTVPATALIATAAGGYAIEALEQDRRVTVPVTPGMFAGGYVAVEGAGVREGMTVIESQ